MAVKFLPGTAPMIAVQTDTDEFERGFVAGLTNVWGPDDRPRYDLVFPADEAGIVELVRNACELAEEGELTEEILRFSVGLVAGWVSRGMSQE
ncbi:MAG TPA: hypothetical protein VF043_07775 [Ktedonobacteraceae bacterium]